MTNHEPSNPGSFSEAITLPEMVTSPEAFVQAVAEAALQPDVVGIDHGSSSAEAMRSLDAYGLTCNPGSPRLALGVYEHVLDPKHNAEWPYNAYGNLITTSEKVCRAAVAAVPILTSNRADRPDPLPYVRAAHVPSSVLREARALHRVSTILQEGLTTAAVGEDSEESLYGQLVPSNKEVFDVQGCTRGNRFGLGAPRELYDITPNHLRDTAEAAGVDLDEASLQSEQLAEEVEAQLSRLMIARSLLLLAREAGTGAAKGLNLSMFVQHTAERLQAVSDRAEPAPQALKALTDIETDMLPKLVELRTASRGQELASGFDAEQELTAFHGWREARKTRQAATEAARRTRRDHGLEVRVEVADEAPAAEPEITESPIEPLFERGRTLLEDHRLLAEPWRTSHKALRKEGLASARQGLEHGFAAGGQTVNGSPAEDVMRRLGVFRQLYALCGDREIPEVSNTLAWTQDIEAILTEDVEAVRLDLAQHDVPLTDIIAKLPKFEPLSSDVAWLQQNWPGFRRLLNDWRNGDQVTIAAVGSVLRPDLPPVTSLPPRQPGIKPIFEEKKPQPPAGVVIEDGSTYEAIAIQLGWEVLPSGTTLEEVKAMSADIVNRRLGPGQYLDWSRIGDLLKLTHDNGGRFYRSKERTFDSDEPYFVSAMNIGRGKGRIAVAESPQYPSASYVVSEKQVDASWPEVLRFTRDQVRQLGGVRVVHAVPDDHLERLQDAVLRMA